MAEWDGTFEEEKCQRKARAGLVRPDDRLGIGEAGDRELFSHGARQKRAFILGLSRVWGSREEPCGGGGL